MTDEVIGSLTGQVDLERGISLTPYIQVYTTWREGEWFRIYTPEQFYSNTRLDGCYEIMCDLDFADSYYWSNTLAKGTFIGKINGNGYTVSNVSVVQADNTQRLGGLFGALGATANVQDITFENVTYTVQAGSRNEGPSYGLLAGEIHTQATLTGVTVSGTLKIDPAMLIPTDYNIGILSGNGENRDIDISGITCVKTDEADTTLNVSVDETGNVKLTRAEQ